MCVFLAAGGIVLVAIDFRGLGEFVRLHPRVRTIDDFVELLIDANFISVETVERCEVGVSFTSSENLEITLEGVGSDDDVFCGEASVNLASLINNPSDEDVARPQVLQFAGAAVSAPAVFEEILRPSNGGQTLVSVASLIVLCITAVLALVL